MGQLACSLARSLPLISGVCVRFAVVMTVDGQPRRVCGLFALIRIRSGTFGSSEHDVCSRSFYAGCIYSKVQ